MKLPIILGFVLSSVSSFANGYFGEGLLQPGRKYVYSYSSSLLTGSKDYVSFSSVANLTGELHIGGNATWLNVHLKNIQIGFYSGEWNANSEPEFLRKSFPQLEPMSQPFSVGLSSGLDQQIALNKSIPLWAKNMQRGIANSLKIELAQVDFKNASEFSRYEKTVFGNCYQKYHVTPRGNGGEAQVRRYRPEYCSKKKRRLFAPDISNEYCFILRSTQLHHESRGFGVYDLELQRDSWVIKRISVGSSIVHTPFGTGDHTQFSSGNMNAILKEVTLGSVLGPGNTEVTSVEFEFGNDDEDDAPNLLLQNGSAYLTNSSQLEAADELLEKIKELHESFRSSAEEDDDIRKLDNLSPLSIIPIISRLDYPHLKEVEGRIKTGDESEYKFFLDALVISGTGPTTLLIRDIVQQSNDTELIRRIISPMASYVRNPTERLLQQMEPLLNKSDHISTETIQLIQFSFATLLGRTCEMRNDCKKSGLLEKYVKIFSSKFHAAPGFREKTQAVHSLSNIQLSPALDVLLKIALDQKEERTVRSSAIGGLVSKTFYPNRHQLLRIFYDREEDPELRNKALLTFMPTADDEEVFFQVARFMWAEENANVKNFVASLFSSFAGKCPCLMYARKIGNFAKAALPTLPPWQVSERYSRQSLFNFFDGEHDLGHMIVLTVEETGLSSTFPRSINIQLFSQIQDYRTNYFSAFVRLEGVQWRGGGDEGPTDFKDLTEILEKIGVEKRESEPFRIEFVLTLHNRVVSYHAFDSKNDFYEIIKLQRIIWRNIFEKENYRILSFGGVTVEQPNDLGIPVSISSALTAVLGFQPRGPVDVNPDPSSRNSQLLNHRLRFNLHGEFSVTNHLPGFDATLSVTGLRSLRLRVPVGLGYFNNENVINTPTEGDPLSARFHSTALTSFSSQENLLKETCPSCKSHAQISKGVKYRKEGQLVDSRLIPGMKTRIKYFDCEKVLSKMDIFHSLKSIFGGAESGIKMISDGKMLPQFLLRSHLLLQTLFLSPKTESCGLEGFVKEETTMSNVNEIEGGGPGPMALRTNVTFRIVSISNGGSGNRNDVILFRNSLGEKFGWKIEVALWEGSRDHTFCIQSQTIPSKTSDFFDYEGVNEPTYENKVDIVWGTKDSPRMEESVLCPPLNGEGVNITNFGRRSIAQQEMAQSDLWPYKECREAKRNDSSSRSRISSMEPCFWAAVEQTTLRQANITIDYKVTPNRWRYASTIAAALLLPFEEEEGEGQNEDSENASGGVVPSSDHKYIQGRIKLNATVDEENSKADIAILPNSQDGKLKRYRNVDFNFIPRPWRQLTSSRFSPKDVESMKRGDSSFCSIAPASVRTYDNVSFSAELSECPTLLSGDCTSKPKFVILGHRIGNERLGLAVYVGHQKLEISALDSATFDGERVFLPRHCYEDYMNVLNVCKNDEDVW